MEEHSSFWFVLCITIFMTLVCCAITREKMRASPLPTAATSTAPVLSLRCRDGYFYIENRYTTKRIPLMDFDSHGEKRQVPCTPAYEAIRSRKMMGYQ